MGNETSQLNGLEINEKAVEICEFWSHHHATIKDSCRYFSLKGDGSVSVFKGDAISGPLWANASPLEKCSNNLLKYRHPSILRYISAWQQRSLLHLATEYVQPLGIVLPTQSPLQICVGLNDILLALVFLHEQAEMSHNDVCVHSIFVTADGHWKLSGLQYLCSFDELSASYLKHSRLYRYDKAVDPNEDSYEVTSTVDQYAFSVLVFDVFKGKNDDEVPHLKEFKKYCKEVLQNMNPALRPPLSNVLQHDFFNHEFILIYQFLNLLPLKSEQEKEQFFLSLLDKLREYDEEIVAKQLGGLLLSRLALLDVTVRKKVIPAVLMPFNERCKNEEVRGLFSIATFKEHIKPRLIQIFSVRDAEIRYLLLSHFSNYVQMFSHEELSNNILPELLLGIKDTDDRLVASTLKCLSDLVPILGGQTVIGGKRSKIFMDGRPNQCTPIIIMNNSTKTTSKPLKDFPCSEEISQDSNDSILDSKLILIERPSPVGGECVDVEINSANNRNSIISDGNVSASEEETWSDWDKPSQSETNMNKSDNCRSRVDAYDKKQLDGNPLEPSKSKLFQTAALKAKTLTDISELDIKTQRADSGKHEYDFFADMVPVINTQVAIVSENNESISSKLNCVQNDLTEELNDGWGQDWLDDEENL